MAVKLEQRVRMIDTSTDLTFCLVSQNTSTPMEEQEELQQ